MLKVVLTGNARFGWGGQGACLANAAFGLSKLSDLTVFCAGFESPQTPFPVHFLGYSIWAKWLLSIPLIRRRTDWAVLLSDLYFDRQVSQQLHLQEYDLIMGVAGQTHLAFSTAKSKGARKWLYCLNNYLPLMQKQIQKEIEYLRDPSVATMHPWMLQRFSQECEQADLIVVLSEVAKQTFIEAGFPAIKIVVLTPYIDPVRFKPSQKSDSTFRVLYIGTIEPRKGVQYLISAFLDAQIPNSELLLIGGAATRALRLLLRDALNNHANIKQEFWDFSRQDPTQVFGRCSVLVLPSVEDGFGIVALEAMACGLPVIVTSHCGAADIVEEGVNGFVVPPRDVNAIAEKLSLLAEDKSYLSEMGKAARFTAEQYTQSRYHRDLEQIFINQGKF